MTSRTRMLLALVAMVVVPVSLLAAVAARLALREERLVRQSFADLALAQLLELRQGLRGVIVEREDRASPLLGVGDEIHELRRFVRREPLFRAALLLDDEGRILFPPDLRTAQEAAFLVRARALVADPGVLVAAANARANASDEKLGTRLSPKKVLLPRAHGWHVWYDDADLDLLFWQRTVGGQIVGVEVDRARLIADVIARLPEGTGSDLSFALLDARGETLHQWGGYVPPMDELPLAALGLHPPLASWRLVVHAPAQTLGALRIGLWSGLGLGLTAIALALAGLAFFLYREHARGLRLAEQRVSFVNRVSHELKTPLTNIRLYAELLQERLDEEDVDAKRQIDVVVSEGQRLGRLIDNVLTFGRHQRGALRLRPARGSVDEVVDRVASRWRSLLEAQGVRLELSLAAPGEVSLDADAITQILDNLLGNALKYAAAGGLVSLSSWREGRTTHLTVEDRGPGIPDDARSRVFLPFERVSDATSEGATGTGIGLAVVRELARLHGGDASVRSGAPGAVFEVSLETPAGEGR